jgi:hypothetical protein
MFRLGLSETNEIFTTLASYSAECTTRKKYFLADLEREPRGKNELGEIAPRRSNLGACKKRCNAVTTPVIAIPYRWS